MMKHSFIATDLHLFKANHQIIVEKVTSIS